MREGHIKAGAGFPLDCFFIILPKLVADVKTYFSRM